MRYCPLALNLSLAPVLVGLFEAARFFAATPDLPLTVRIVTCFMALSLYSAVALLSLAVSLPLSLVQAPRLGRLYRFGSIALTVCCLIGLVLNARITSDESLLHAFSTVPLSLVAALVLALALLNAVPFQCHKALGATLAALSLFTLPFLPRLYSLVTSPADSETSELYKSALLDSDQTIELTGTLLTRFMPRASANDMSENVHPLDDYADLPLIEPPIDDPKPLPEMAPQFVAQPLGNVHRPNIIHITIDALSPYHVGYHGYERATTPRMDAYSARGRRFMWAFSQGPHTRSSIPSSFAGHFPSEMHRSPDNWPIFWPTNQMIAEHLQAAGYLTAGLPAHRFMLPGYGMSQGFTEWDLSLITDLGENISNSIVDNLQIDRALAWLKAHEHQTEPFYLWMHCFDPHHFYKSHASEPEIEDFGNSPLDRYDQEIRATDRELGRLFDFLDQSELRNNTFVLVHADHGEAFGERGYRFHGQSLFNDQIRVPLFLVGPGVKPETITYPVALLDIPTTLKSIAKLVEDPMFELLDPRSLLYNDPTPRAIWSEMLEDKTHAERRTLVMWPYKLHYSIAAESFKLFDLSQDPNEEQDLRWRDKETFKRMRDTMMMLMQTKIQPKAPYWFY